jgi:spore germination cell wall hydrolase CwlJ-like protein
MTQGGILLLLAAMAAHNHQVKAEHAEQAERNCMTQALYYEARGEGERGQEAVAEVILRRTKSGNYPNTVCGVVREPHQFSFLTDGSMSHKVDRQAWEASYDLAVRILSGKLVTSFTKRATHYHQIDVQPEWSKVFVVTARIGNHLFYSAPTQKSKA